MTSSIYNYNSHNFILSQTSFLEDLASILASSLETFQIIFHFEIELALGLVSKGTLIKIMTVKIYGMNLGQVLFFYKICFDSLFILTTLFVLNYKTFWLFKVHCFYFIYKYSVYLNV